MKKTFILLAVASLSLVSCETNHKSDMLKNEVQKQEIFSEILSSDKLLSDFMDTMMLNHNYHDKMMALMQVKMKSDKNMQMGMMGGMMDMCEKDTGMCKQMMQMMKDKPNIMKMSNMEPTTVVQDNLDHNKHHAPMPKIAK